MCLYAWGHRNHAVFFFKNSAVKFPGDVHFCELVSTMPPASSGNPAWIAGIPCESCLACHDLKRTALIFPSFVPGYVLKKQNHADNKSDPERGRDPFPEV